MLPNIITSTRNDSRKMSFRLKKPGAIKTIKDDLGSDVMAENEDGLANELDAILDSYSSDPKQDAASEEQELEFLAKFERIRVEIIKPVMEQIGKYLEKKGHAYHIKDEAGVYRGNPNIKMEIYPKTQAGEEVQEHEFPTIVFIAEPDISTVGIEVRDGMPGRPGLTRGHTTTLDSLTNDYVKSQIITVIKMNFAKKARKK